MIFERSGNMFEHAPMGALIGIPVNTVGVAGKGIALHMKLRYPDAHAIYKEACRRGKMATGDLIVVDVLSFKLAMLPTKYSWTQPSETGLIDATLCRLVEYMQEHNIEEVHLPHLGCGINTGQLNYREDVYPIIEHYFGNEEQKEAVYVYSG